MLVEMRADSSEKNCQAEVDLNMNCHRLIARQPVKSDDDHLQNDGSCGQIVTLNVGGAVFQTSYSTLKNIPNTRLCAITEEPESCQGDRTFFFDRNPQLFNFILDFYRTGELHIPKGHCAQSLKRELHFWGLNEACINECCWAHYVKSTNQLKQYRKLREEFGDMSGRTSEEGNVTWRGKLWIFLEEPSSSSLAKLYAAVTNLLILVNVLTYMLGTLPSFRVPNPDFEYRYNSTTGTHSNGTKLERWMTSVEHPGIFYFDFACLIFFFLECVIRFIVCPHKVYFFKSFKTIADLFYIVPLTVLHMIYMLDHTVWSDPRNIPALLILQGFVAFRVCRLVLVARNYRPFVILTLSLKASGRELLLLVILVLLALVFFSNAIFLAEITREDTFANVFEGLWWSLITITTVGYGDVVPKTTFGFVVGSICAVSGLILISLPIPVIAKNFNSYYSFKTKPSGTAGVNWTGNLKRTDTEETVLLDEDGDMKQIVVENRCIVGRNKPEDPQQENT